MKLNYCSKKDLILVALLYVPIWLQIFLLKWKRHLFENWSHLLFPILFIPISETDDHRQDSPKPVLAAFEEGDERAMPWLLSLLRNAEQNLQYRGYIQFSQHCRNLKSLLNFLKNQCFRRLLCTTACKPIEILARLDRSVHIWQNCVCHCLASFAVANTAPLCCCRWWSRSWSCSWGWGAS